IRASRGEPRAVRAEGVSIEVLVVALANGRLLPGSRVKHRELTPVVPSLTRQPCAVGAHDDGSGNRVLVVRPDHATKNAPGVVEQVKGRAIDPRGYAKAAAGLGGVDTNPAFGA